MIISNLRIFLTFFLKGLFSDYPLTYYTMHVMFKCSDNIRPFRDIVKCCDDVDPTHSSYNINITVCACTHRHTTCV